MPPTASPFLSSPLAPLSVLLLATFGLMVVRRRHLGRLASFATLLAAIMLMIWLQDSGLLPGTRGPLSDTRPRTTLDRPGGESGPR